jgi:hypothetical protein
MLIAVKSIVTEDDEGIGHSCGVFSMFAERIRNFAKDRFTIVLTGRTGDEVARNKRFSE